MSRVEKRYKRLNDLESQYRGIAAREMGRILTHGYSSLIARKASTFRDGKYWWDGDKVEFERLEKEIVCIREQLNEPLAASPIHAVRRLCQQIEQIGIRRWHETRPLINETLEAWGARAPEARDAVPDPGRTTRITFHVDKLPQGCQFPCSVRELKQLIRSLPPDHVRGIDSVRLSTQQGPIDGLWLSDGRVELRWVVDSQGRRGIGRRPPSPGTLAEWAHFGGTCVAEEGVYYAFWPDRRQLSRYVQFILLHEIGHHVFNRLWRRRYFTKQQEEEFADRYAYQYLPKCS